MSAPGEPSLRSLRHNDVMVFALFDTVYVDVYFLGARVLSDWIFMNPRRCDVKRLFFPGRKDVIVLKIPIALVIHDLGTSARLYRVNLGGRMAGMFGVWGFG